MPRRRLDEPDESANFDLDYGDGLDYSKPPSSSNPFPRDDSTTTKSPPRNLTTPPPPDLLEAPKSQLIHPRALPAAYQDHDERPPTEQESDGREEGEVSSPESQHAPLPVPSASASRRSPFLGEHRSAEGRSKSRTATHGRPPHTAQAFTWTSKQDFSQSTDRVDPAMYSPYHSSPYPSPHPQDFPSGFASVPPHMSVPSYPSHAPPPPPPLPPQYASSFANYPGAFPTYRDRSAPPLPFPPHPPSNPHPLHSPGRPQRGRVSGSRRHEEPPPKLLKRKPMRKKLSLNEASTSLLSGERHAQIKGQGPVASTSEAPTDIMIDTAPQDPFRNEEEKKTVMELVYQLHLWGMSRSALIDQGIAANIVDACYRELGIGNENRQQPPDPTLPHQSSTDLTDHGASAPNLSSALADGTNSKVVDVRSSDPRPGLTEPYSETPSIPSRTPDPSPTSLPKTAVDASLALRQAVFESMKRKAQKGKAATKEAVELQSTNATGNAERRLRQQNPNIPQTSASYVRSENEASAPDMYGTLGLQTSDATDPGPPEEPKAVSTSKGTRYQDVDAPQGEDITPAFNLSSRQRISYVDDFDARPEAPAGEVDYNAPLPTLDLPSYDDAWNRSFDDGSVYPTRESSSSPFPQPSTSVSVRQVGRRRPVASDFDGGSLQTPPMNPVQRLRRFLPQPYRVRLVLEVSDDEGDSDDSESSESEFLYVRRQTTRDIYHLWAESELTESSDSNGQTWEGSGARLGNSVGPEVVPKGSQRTDQQSRQRENERNKMDELSRKEQAIREMMERIKELERRRGANSNGEGSPNGDSRGSPIGSGRAGAESLSGRPERPTPMDQLDPPAVENHSTSTAAPTDPAVASKPLALDPALQAQKEALLASLRAKKGTKRKMDDRDSGEENQAEAHSSEGRISKSLSNLQHESPSPSPSQTVAKADLTTSDLASEASEQVAISEKAMSQHSPTPSPHDTRDPSPEPSTLTTSLLSNMTSRFKSYISPFSKFSSLARSLTRPGSSTTSSSNNDGWIDQARAQNSTRPSPVNKRLCRAQVEGSDCLDPECLKAHFSDFGQGEGET